MTTDANSVELDRQVRGCTTSPAPPLFLVAPNGVTPADALHTVCGPMMPAGDGVQIVPLRCTTHALDPDVVEYIDGVIVSYCLTCRERFEIRWLPGGTGALRLRAVAELILEQVDEHGEVPEVLVDQLLDAHDRVRADHELIEDSEALYQTLRRVIEHL